MAYEFEYSSSSLALALQNNLDTITVLLVFWFDAVQFQVGRPYSELHIDPTMGMAFSEIVTDCGLVNEMEMVLLIMLPFMRVAIEIGPCMLVCGK